MTSNHGQAADLFVGHDAGSLFQSHVFPDGNHVFDHHVVGLDFGQGIVDHGRADALHARGDGLDQRALRDQTHQPAIGVQDGQVAKAMLLHEGLRLGDRHIGMAADGVVGHAIFDEHSHS